MNRVFLALLFLCLALPGHAQRRHGKRTLDVGLGLTAFDHTGGFSGSFSLAQEQPNGAGYFLDIHSYSQLLFSYHYGGSDSGSVVALGGNQTWTKRVLFTTVGVGLGQEEFQRYSVGSSASRRIGIYARAGVGVERHSLRLSVSGFGLATTRQPVFGMVFAVGVRF